MEAAELFLSTRAGGFLAGFCVAVGTTASILSVAFYFEFRKKFLLHFAGVAAIINFCMILANKDPYDLAELGGDPILFRMFHLLVVFAMYFYYRLLDATTENQNARGLQILSLTTLLAILSRLIIVVTGMPQLFPFAAFFTVAYMFSAMAVLAMWKPSTISHRLCQLSSFGMMSLIFYPLIRSGIIPQTGYENLYVWLILFCVTVSSIVWLLGLVHLAREEADAVRAQETNAREKAFYDLRDFLNNPLQVLLAAIEISERDRDSELTKKMKRAVTRLTKLNIFLGKYAKDSDWTKKKQYFDEKEIE